MGTMNAMPMMYALELRKMGYEVIYFVDVNRSETLSRPESHFPEIEYPYPSWIVEFILPTQLLLPIFSKILTNLYENKIKGLTDKPVGCFILNGFFTALTPHLSKDASKVALSHGSDLDVWANTDKIQPLADGIQNRSIFKYLPRIISNVLIKHIVMMQHNGYLHSDAILYFPIGFNPTADLIIKSLGKLGILYIPRYDISFEPLQGQSRTFKKTKGKLQLFSGVRFLYRTFSEGDRGSSKGNDRIIEGVAKYYRRNPNIQVHFVEKGEDVAFAKELCQKLELQDVVVWHKEMPFKELLALYQKSDICFDQVGPHWIGAIGGYALWLGKPLIANAESAIRSGIWPVVNPICSACSADEVYQWLVKLEDESFRELISTSSKRFVETHMCAKRSLDLLFDYQHQK